LNQQVVRIGGFAQIVRTLKKAFVYPGSVAHVLQKGQLKLPDLLFEGTKI
jgi:hypothetical protein